MPLLFLCINVVIVVLYMEQYFGGRMMDNIEIRKLDCGVRVAM